MMRTLFFVASMLLLPCLAFGADPSVDLSVQVVPSGPAISPDGAKSSAPSGAALTTTAGVWTWGAAAAGRPGENTINLNGVYAPGIGNLMEVANGGKLYVNTATAGWYVWSNGAFAVSSDPTAPPPPPPPPPGPSAQCSTTPPAEAQKAGFTAMVMCQDFTQPIPNTAGTGVTTGWVNVCGGPAGTPQWFQYGNAGPIRCNNFQQVTDGANGLVMHIYYDPAQCVSPGNQLCRVNIQTDDFSSLTPGVGNYFVYPQASYAQITYRDDLYVNHTPCDGINNTAFWMSSHEGGAGHAPPNEFDVIENWGGGVNCQSQVTDEALHNWNGDPGGFVPASSVWNFHSIGNWAGTTWSYAATNGYHTYGMLTTTNGSDNMEVCGYIDDFLLNCTQFPGITDECRNDKTGAALPNINGSGCWGQKNYPIVWVGSAGGPAPHNTVNAWIKSWQVWSCPAWNVGDPRISTAANSCYGSIISSENAIKGARERFASLEPREQRYLLSKMSPRVRAEWLADAATSDQNVITDQLPSPAPVPSEQNAVDTKGDLTKSKHLKWKEEAVK
jgi:hypothetical protein